MLDKIKGVDIGDQYVNDKAVAIMVKNIAAVTRKEVCDKLRESPFFSLTCDGVTDFTGEELENIYIRTCNGGKLKLKVCICSLEALNQHQPLTFTYYSGRYLRAWTW